MNTRKLWFIIGGIVLIIAAAMTYLLLNGNGANQPLGPQGSYGTDLPAQVDPETAPTTQESTPQPGKYEAYSAEVVARDSGRKVLFFHAPWCPQCRALEQSIQAGTIPDNVTIYKVDFDTSHDLRTKYGVNLQTTLVEIDSGGNALKKYVAYQSPTLEAAVKGLGLE